MTAGTVPADLRRTVPWAARACHAGRHYLPGRSLLFLLAFSRSANQHNGAFTARVETLAERLQLDERTIQRAMSTLEYHGAISRTPRFWRSKRTPNDPRNRASLYAMRIPGRVLARRGFTAEQLEEIGADRAPVRVCAVCALTPARRTAFDARAASLPAAEGEERRLALGRLARDFGVRLDVLAEHLAGHASELDDVLDPPLDAANLDDDGGERPALSTPQAPAFGFDELEQAIADELLFDPGFARVAEEARAAFEELTRTCNVERITSGASLPETLKAITDAALKSTAMGNVEERRGVIKSYIGAAARNRAKFPVLPAQSVLGRFARYRKLQPVASEDFVKKVLAVASESPNGREPDRMLARVLGLVARAAASAPSIDSTIDDRAGRKAVRTHVLALVRQAFPPALEGAEAGPRPRPPPS